MFLFNTNRIGELASEESIQKAATALIRLPWKPLLQALAIMWGVVLVMAFSMLFVIRLALSIPL